MPAATSWSKFWDNEAAVIGAALPSPLTGSAPISVLLLQPSEDKRMVFLTPPAPRPRVISLPFGPNTEKQLFKGGAGIWDSKVHYNRPSTIEAYCKLDKSIRKPIFDIESQLYGRKLYNCQDFHLLDGIQYRLQTVVPSPLFHSLQQWWTRLPRLGIAYTVADALGAYGCNRPQKSSHASGRLLLIAATAAGNGILAARLRLVCENRYRSPSEDALIRNDRQVPDVEREEAYNLYSKAVHPAAEVSWDNCLYLVAKLTFAHSIFFPNEPIAYQIFSLLGVADLPLLLMRHGWFAQEFPAIDYSLDESISLLVADLVFLIRALVPLRKLRDERESLYSDSELSSIVRQLLMEVLAVVCGTVEKIGDFWTISPPEAISAQKNLPNEKIVVPAFKESQIDSRHNRRKTANKKYEHFLGCLSPVNRFGRVETIKEMRNYKEIRFPRKPEDEPKDHRKRYPWFVRYVRARIETESRT